TLLLHTPRIVKERLAAALPAIEPANKAINRVADGEEDLVPRRNLTQFAVVAVEHEFLEDAPQTPAAGGGPSCNLPALNRRSRCSQFVSGRSRRRRAFVEERRRRQGRS